jgi:DNA polymerase-3 subunit delta
MPVLGQEVVVAQLAKGELHPLYVVVGDDEYAKDEFARALQGAVPEDVQPFAFERYSALDATTTPATVVNSARTLPFLGDRRVIVVTRAEKWFTGRRKGGDDAAGDDDDGAAGGLEVLEAYLERLEPAATVAFIAADVNRTFRVVKALLKQAIVVECWGLKGEKDPRGPANEVLTRAGRLAAGLFKRAGLTIDARALEKLLAHAGSDIGVLRGDVERVSLYCHGRRTVTAEDVDAVVAGTALLNPWGVVSAVERGDAREALRQIRVVSDAGEAPYMTLGQIGWWVRNKLPQLGAPDRVRAAVDAVFRTDLAMKSSGGEPRILLEKLVVELCGRPGPGGRGPSGRGPGGPAPTRRAWP